MATNREIGIKMGTASGGFGDAKLAEEQRARFYAQAYCDDCGSAPCTCEQEKTC